MEVISRREFLEFGAKSPLVLISANLKAQSPDGKVYDPPENQTWVDFQSPNYPYTIRHPSNWSVFFAETLLDRLTNPREVKADIFSGGQVGKKTMKVIVTSEVLAEKVTIDDLVAQIEEEGSRLGREPRVVNSGWVSEDYDSDWEGYYTKFLDFEIERRTYPLHVTATTSNSVVKRGWRIIAELQDYEFKVSEFERDNINRTIVRILQSFSVT